MVQFVNLRELKIHASEVIHRSHRGDIVVTVHGRPRAILHAIAEEDLEEYLMEHSPLFLRKMERAIREAKEGKLHSYESVFGRTQPKKRPRSKS